MKHKSFKIAFWASVARLIGVCLGSGMGSLVYQAVGPGAHSYWIAVLLGLVSIGLLIFSEYEREVARDVANTSGEPSARKCEATKDFKGEPAQFSCIKDEYE